MKISYKNDTSFYCGEGEMSIFNDNSTTVNLWSNVTFYRVSGPNGTIIRRVSLDTKKYIFDPTRNVLTIKSICNLIDLKFLGGKLRFFIKFNLLFLVKNDIMSKLFCNNTSNNIVINYVFQSNFFMD
jgi:hypothetical protein